MATERHAAIVEVNIKDLLEFMDFEGGKVHDAKLDFDTWADPSLKIKLEHPDLPVCRPGDSLQYVVPTYHSQHHKFWVRVDPPKQVKEE